MDARSTPSPASHAFLGPVIRTTVVTPCVTPSATPAGFSFAAYQFPTSRSPSPSALSMNLPSPQRFHLESDRSPSPVSIANNSLSLQGLHIASLSRQRGGGSALLHQGGSTTSSTSSSGGSVASTTARPADAFPVFRLPPVEQAPLTYRLREAMPWDIEGILALTAALDMTHATSFVWPREELADRVARRDPLVVVAVVDETNEVAGCAGIDTLGMGNKQLTVYAIGSRVLPALATEQYTFPSSYCNCRGLLIHPNHQGAGLGSRLHRTRLEILAQVAPHTPAVVLSARGTTFEEALSTLGPLLQPSNDEEAASRNVTPQFTKESVFEFTFQTSNGIVHLAHQREGDGWRFVGVDVSDGGPVWCTSIPLPKLVSTYPTSRRPTAVFLEPLANISAGAG